MIREYTALCEGERFPETGAAQKRHETHAAAGSWYLLYTKPRKEDSVTESLRRVNRQVYNPKLIKRQRMNGVQKKQVSPLFPCYVFAKFEIPYDIRMIQYTRGVRRIISFDGMPTPVSDGLVSVIRSREREGYVEMVPSFQDGDSVVVKEGPFRDFIGIFQNELNDSERVVVLLSAIATKRIVIQRSCIERL